jgi:hypothetical protein
MQRKFQYHQGSIFPGNYPAPIINYVPFDAASAFVIDRIVISHDTWVPFIPPPAPPIALEGFDSSPSITITPFVTSHDKWVPFVPARAVSAPFQQSPESFKNPRISVALFDDLSSTPSKQIIPAPLQASQELIRNRRVPVVLNDDLSFGPSPRVVNPIAFFADASANVPVTVRMVSYR